MWQFYVRLFWFVYFLSINFCTFSLNLCTWDLLPISAGKLFLKDILNPKTLDWERFKLYIKRKIKKWVSHESGQPGLMKMSSCCCCMHYFTVREWHSTVKKCLRSLLFIHITMRSFWSDYRTYVNISGFLWTIIPGRQLGSSTELRVQTDESVSRTLRSVKVRYRKYLQELWIQLGTSLCWKQVTQYMPTVALFFHLLHLFPEDSADCEIWIQIIISIIIESGIVFFSCSLKCTTNQNVIKKSL